MFGKSLIGSKTFWFNMLTAALAFTDTLPPKYAAIAASVGNVVLRVFFTDKPITSWVPTQE